MTNLFNNSETFFFKFINKFDIILDDNYSNIKELYYSTKKISNTTYKPYLNLFQNYKHFKDDINFIYYIIILYYTERNDLLNFIRFFTSKINNYKLIDKPFIKDYKTIRKYNKTDLIKYLNKIINVNDEILLFFIICIQLYF